MSFQRTAFAYDDDSFAGQGGDVFFSGFLLNARRRSLQYRGTPVTLTPKEFDLLVVLVERFGAPASRDELILSVWLNKEITDYTLSQTVHRLRRSLANHNPAGDYIQTLPGFGYQFVAPVEPFEDADRGDEFLRGPAAELMRARSLLSAGSPPDFRSAIALFKRGLREEPEYLPALLGMAYAYISAADLGVLPHHEAYTNARSAIERAIRLAPVSGDSIALLAHIALFAHRDPTAAARLAAASLRISPSSVLARTVAAWVSIVKGDWEEAQRHVGAIFKMDPSSPAIDKLLAAIFYFAGLYEDAHGHAHGALKRNPADYAGILLAARVRVALRDYRGAREVLATIPAGISTPHAHALHAIVAAAESEFERSERILDTLRSAGIVSNACIALALIAMNRFDEAATAVLRAADDADPQLLLLLRDPVAAEFWRSPSGATPRERVESAVTKLSRQLNTI
ncbi:MAG TPA: tetratricopeptide repeat protein [Candidatus Baltobacteraceae bacterium]|jgi:DNA-binding winged helix-turn-helix (wHTH) protein|nr:tetratricopeptide repeat protein [Candidatus Baltobacteraceae bacterium]